MLCGLTEPPAVVAQDITFIGGDVGRERGRVSCDNTASRSSIPFPISSWSIPYFLYTLIIFDIVIAFSCAVCQISRKVYLSILYKLPKVYLSVIIPLYTKATRPKTPISSS